jgi:hypothetical protein
MRTSWLALAIAMGPATVQLGSARAETPSPPYLSEMPTVAEVQAGLQGKDAMDSAARQMGTFWQLQEIIGDLAGPRWARNELTADERRLLGQYRGGYQSAAEPFSHVQNAPSHPDRSKWFQLHSFYETDEAFREELFERFLSPALRDAYARATGTSRALAGGREPPYALTAEQTRELDGFLKGVCWIESSQTRSEIISAIVQGMNAPGAKALQVIKRALEGRVAEPFLANDSNFRSVARMLESARQP